MNRKKTLWAAVAALIVFLTLFEVSINLEFSLAGEGRELDAEQEARYRACYAGRDKQIHDVAFGTIDNPDVQKLYIANNRDLAAAECREDFPEQWVVTARPSRFNLVDVRFRF